MTTTRSSYVLGSEDGESLWGIDGTLSTIKVSADKAAGSFALVEELATRGDGIPFHRHPDDDETFYVLEGELSFFFEDDVATQASTGSVVHIPGGATHSFRVDSDTARYLIMTTAQHERFYRAISTPAASRTLPPQRPMDMDTVEAACQAYNVEVLGPPPGAPA